MLFKSFSRFLLSRVLQMFPCNQSQRVQLQTTTHSPAHAMRANRHTREPLHISSARLQLHRSCSVHGDARIGCACVGTFWPPSAWQPPQTPVVNVVGWKGGRGVGGSGAHRGDAPPAVAEGGEKKKSQLRRDLNPVPSAAHQSGSWRNCSQEVHQKAVVIISMQSKC